MIQRTILDDLHAHGNWSNHKLFALCQPLTDEQLDTPREMGFGSLRNTCFHILEAEQLWLERYSGQPWRPLRSDAEGMPIADILRELDQVVQKRDQLAQELLTEDTNSTITFVDLAQKEWTFPLRQCQLHVSNHGIHHRAQVLSFLRQFGTSVAGGVDYLFFKLAYPSVTIPQESHAPLTDYGLEVHSGEGAQPIWDADFLKTYLDYDTWATNQVFAAAEALEESTLDSKLEMGPGSLRATLQHIIDANRWWLENWKQDKSPFPRGEDPRSLAEMNAQHLDVIARREQFVETLDDEAAARIVSVTAGGPVTCFRVLESLLQLAGHGTHHRAQCVNMIRTLGAKPPTIDLIEWLRCLSL